MWIQRYARRQVSCGVAVLFVSALGLPVTAEVGVAEQFLQISATSVAGSASLDVSASELFWDSDAQSLSWGAGETLEFVDPETDVVLATLDAVDLQITEGSRFAISLRLLAGADDVTFTFRTGELRFESIAADAAEGRVAVSARVWDMDGDGAILTGEGGGGTGAFRAYFNGPPPSGQRFAHLVALVAAGSGGTASGSQNVPPFGFLPIGESVEDMSVEVAFVLTAHDQATVSATYDIDPDPAGWADDADADGLPDWLDGCPDDPEKTEPGECGCGVADDDCSSPPSSDDEDGDGEVADGSGTAPDASDDESPTGVQASPGGESVGPNGTGTGQPAGGPGLVSGEVAELLNQIDPTFGALVAPCGAGAVAFMPLTLLALGGYRVGVRRRPARR